MDSDDFDELIGLFIAETQEFLQSLETNLLAMEGNRAGEARLQAVKTLFRAAHSIKGSASMFGFTTLSKAAHCLEDCFAILRDRVELSQLEQSTVTLLLQGVDRLRSITDIVCKQTIKTPTELGIQVDNVEMAIASHLDAIAKIKIELEAKYGQEDNQHIPSINGSFNQEIVKSIFEKELLSVFNQLETEISQSNPNTLSQNIAAINDINYQISGVAGMLQLSYLAEMAEQLQALIDIPNLTVEQLQASGWKIAQNLQTIRNQVLQGQPVNVLSSVMPENDSRRVEERTRELEEDKGTETPEYIDICPLPTSYSSPSPSHPLTPSSDSWQRPTIRIEVERLTELINLVGELVINRTNFELQEAQLRCETKRIRKSILALHNFGSQLREEYDRLAIDNGKLVAKNQVKKPEQIIFDLLELDQYTEFHSTAIEVIEVTQSIAQSASLIDELAFKFEHSTDQLRRITDQLRSRVMQLRVVPFSRVVDHLPRALRELCRTYNKDVNLLLLGRDTKIDESLLDALREPLVHLLRNAFDHGIEPPEIRLAAGKPASGQIEIEARHQGGQTIITVTDDGKGIDPEVIRNKVINMGLLPAEQVSNLQTAELYEFLFWPGFSTVNEVTSLSGRGVGMDIVRNNLRRVRGTIKVDSHLGKGTSFILKFPLMLSITDALMVRVDRNTVAVPLDAVEEILHIQGEQIQMAGNQPMLRWQGEFIRLVRLQELLVYNVPHPDGPSPDPLNQDYIPVMILAASEGVLAVAVERIVGQQEIVVKSLPSPLSKPHGIVGCTILGDGEVVTILDVDELIEKFYNQGATTISTNNKFSALLRTDLLIPAPIFQPQILVVDDSYTIRQLLSVTLTRARYRVVQAKDGQDALTKLEQGLVCDLVIADIEMPRMDGFELLRSLKANVKFAEIPVAMLTSRSSARHRQMALELGAVQYFTKPYNEIQLLEAIAKLIKNAK